MENGDGKEAIERFIHWCYHGLFPHLKEDSERLQNIVLHEELVSHLAHTQKMLRESAGHLDHERKVALLRKYASIAELKKQASSATIDTVHTETSHVVSTIPSSSSSDRHPPAFEDPKPSKVTSVENIENRQEGNTIASATETRAEQKRDTATPQSETTRPTRSPTVADGARETGVQATSVSMVNHADESTAGPNIPSTAVADASHQVKRKGSAELANERRPSKPSWQEKGWDGKGKEGHLSLGVCPGPPPKYPYMSDSTLNREGSAWL